MSLRVSYALLLPSLFAALGASYRTDNFIVEAPTAEIAQQVGEAAERYRLSEAKKWLGKEIPSWSEPCEIYVTLTERFGGLSNFRFMNGTVEQTVRVDGTVERIVEAVLPHEITHVVLFHYFRRPPPRWADEGSALLSENDVQQRLKKTPPWELDHDPASGFSLRSLFTMQDYPSREKLEAFYAEAYSITRFLVESSSRKDFLRFVWEGMANGWDGAAQSYYGYNGIEEMEQAWRQQVRNKRLKKLHAAQERERRQFQAAQTVLLLAQWTAPEPTRIIPAASTSLFVTLELTTATNKMHVLAPVRPLSTEQLPVPASMPVTTTGIRMP